MAPPDPSIPSAADRLLAEALHSAMVCDEFRDADEIPDGFMDADSAQRRRAERVARRLENYLRGRDARARAEGARIGLSIASGYDTLVGDLHAGDLTDVGVDPDEGTR